MFYSSWKKYLFYFATLKIISSIIHKYEGQFSCFKFPTYQPSLLIMYVTPPANVFFSSETYFREIKTKSQGVTLKKGWVYKKLIPLSCLLVPIP